MKYIIAVLLLFVLSSCISNESLQPMRMMESCKEGTSRTGFTSPHPIGDKPCMEGTQTCVGGEWIGPDIYKTCDGPLASRTDSQRFSAVNPASK